MFSQAVLFYLLFAYNVQSQVIPDCSTLSLPPGLPSPLKALLSLATTSIPATPTINYKKICPDLNCGYMQAPIVPPCGCYNPAIGFPNPVIGVQGCGCTNSFGACGCSTPVVGNLCGRTTPAIGLTTTCGCSDPNVRIVDGCPSCQSVYSYNLPSLGVPAFSSVGLSTFGYGVGVPGLLPPIGLPACGCSPLGPFTCSCGRPINVCTCNSGCPKPCACNGPCTCPVSSCGCVEVPCGPPKMKTTCTCVTPTVETPCGCAQGKPTCACATTVEVPTCGVPVVPPFAPVIGCSRYLRQVVVQPPFL